MCVRVCACVRVSVLDGEGSGAFANTALVVYAHSSTFAQTLPHASVLKSFRVPLVDDWIRIPIITFALSLTHASVLRSFVVHLVDLDAHHQMCRVII